MENHLNVIVKEVVKMTGRIDYDAVHYCKTCEIKYPLTIWRCTEIGCHRKLTTKCRKQKKRVWVNGIGRSWTIKKEILENKARY